MAVFWYYITVFTLSVIATLFFIWFASKDTDIYFSLIFIFIPISNLGNVFLCTSDNLSSAMLGNKLIYLGGCFLPLFITLSMVNMYKLNIKKIYILISFGLSFLMYAFILTSDMTSFFYKNVDFKVDNGIPSIEKSYGPVHSLFYILIIGYAIAGISIITYCLAKKEEVSLRTIVIFAVIEMLSIMSYFMGKIFDSKVELTPASYLLFQIAFLFMIGRTELYNVGRNQAAAVMGKDDNGFLLVDLKHRYIGSNFAARAFFPELADIRIDGPFEDNLGEEGICRYIDGCIKEYTQNADEQKQHAPIERILERNNRIYKISLEYLVSRKTIKGYRIFMTDETEERRYTELLKKYNDELEEEVEEKTSHIQEIQDKMVLGLATMVEGRDLSTGGHIKRTSHVVGVLIKEMRKGKMEGLDDEFCRLVVKAAPMHDIGKIAVDDAVLRKPGRFTPEEYAMMKTHAAKGAELIKEILADIEEPRFKKIAENVAHYHHERWDGSGYPEGLKGEEIPLEARIMAVADVYDALVSKRCYKESMSFEQAFEIIEDGMGKHFDASLNPYFLSAREKLEAYYSAEGAAGRA